MMPSMRPAAGTLIVLLLACLVPAADAANPNFDLSSVREFWPVVDILTRDREPAPEEWARLFDSTGHNTLRREFEDEIFMKYLRAAYMPGATALREEILAAADSADSWFRRWFPRSELEALDWTLAHRDEVEAMTRSLRSYPYVEQATREALAFLPETEAPAPPDVAFVIFNDSRGYDPVIMSLNLLARQRAELPEDLERRLAEAGRPPEWPLVLHFGHEFFHHFRALRPAFAHPPQDHPDRHLVWAIDQIANEGVADQINVKQLYGEGGPFAGSAPAEEELRGRDGAADEVAAFAEAMAGIARDRAATAELAAQARSSLTRAGHVAGFYMSETILRHFPREELVAAARDPFAFFLLYDRAAARDGGAPRIPEEARGLVRELQETWGREAAAGD